MQARVQTDCLAYRTKVPENDLSERSTLVSVTVPNSNSKETRHVIKDEAMPLTRRRRKPLFPTEAPGSYVAGERLKVVRKVIPRVGWDQTRSPGPRSTAARRFVVHMVSDTLAPSVRSPQRLRP